MLYQYLLKELELNSDFFFIFFLSPIFLRSTRLHPSNVQSQMKPREKMAEAAAKTAYMLCKQYATKLAGVAFISFD